MTEDTPSAALNENQLDIPTDDRPSMGDPAFVTDKVRAMLAETLVIRKDYHLTADGHQASTVAQAKVTDLIERWTTTFSARNSQFVQTMTPGAQSEWLRQHGYGARDPADDLTAPVSALISNTIKRVLDAAIAHEEGGIDDEMARFRTDVAVEDCISMLLGIENSADEEG